MVNNPESITSVLDGSYELRTYSHSGPTERWVVVDNYGTVGGDWVFNITQLKAGGRQIAMVEHFHDHQEGMNHEEMRALAQVVGVVVDQAVAEYGDERLVYSVPFSGQYDEENRDMVLRAAVEQSVLLARGFTPRIVYDPKLEMVTSIKYIRQGGKNAETV